jgi:hypothetical protein
MNASQKYGLVRAIAFILKLLAWLALIAGVLAAIVSGTSGSAIPGLSTLGVIAGPVLGIVWFVQLFAFGSILSLLVDIEENTRQLTAEAVSDR